MKLVSYTQVCRRREGEGDLHRTLKQGERREAGLSAGEQNLQGWGGVNTALKSLQRGQVEEGDMFSVPAQRVGIFLGGGGWCRRAFKNLVQNLGVWLPGILGKCLL